MRKRCRKARVGSGRNLLTSSWLAVGMLAAFGGSPDCFGAQVEPQERPTQQPQVGEPAATETEQPRPVTPKPPDRVEQLLKNLDPKLLNLSGAELDVEIVGDKLILRGNEADLNVIKLLVGLLEGTTEQKELQVVTVTERDATDIAAKLGQALPRIITRPNQRPEDEPVVTAISANVLVVAALPTDIDFIVDVIKQVDAVKEELPPLEQLVFPIKNRRASEVAEQLTDIIKKIQEKKGVTGAKGEIQVIPNDANNSIMILAPETEREKLQRLLNELDVEPVKGWGEVKLVLFPLVHSKASELADVVTELLTSQVEREDVKEVISRLQISRALPSGEIEDLPPIDLQRPTRIIADEGTNSLIVATVEENVGPLGELIRLLDGVPMAAEVGIKLFPLEFGDAQTIADILKDLFEQGKKLPPDPDGSGTDAVPEGTWGKALAYEIGISPELRSNTIIVSGRPEQLMLAAMVIEKLDQPATALKFPLRLIPLTHTDASQIGKLIQELLDQRFEALEATDAGKAALERERVFLSVDIQSNSLLVSASEENYEEILSIVAQLDTKPARLFEQIRIIRCHRLSAKDLKEKIDELWKRKADLRREEELLEDVPVVAVDDRSNSLIVASAVEDFEEIKRLVDTLESQPLIESTQLFKLEYADATVLSGMLEKLFEGIAGQSDTFQAPTIIPDPRSSALVVAATQDAMERVADLVKRLDVEAGPKTAVFKVYPLEHASSARLAPQIQELFDTRTEGVDIPRTPIVVIADEASNSLVCSASRDDHEIVAELLELLDRPSSIAKQVEIFPLRRAKAVTVAEKLEALFQSQAEGISGRADAIAAEPDERTNSIIVWASPSQMVNIAEIIKRLDTSSPAVEMMVKVIQLRQALAKDFADLLQKTLIGEGGGGDQERAIIVSFLEKRPDGTQTLRKLLRQDITIEADPRTNSLMVMAPADSMAMLEAMIRDFDTIRPIRSELRLFPLMNSDAEAMVEQLTDLFEAKGTEGEAKSQLVFGDTVGEFDIASVGQELRFTADTRTNTVIAAGAEVDLRMAEELIRYLDAQEAEDRVSVVYPAAYRNAQDLATAIQDFNQQEQDVLGEVDDQEARSRRMERQISVVSMGEEDKGSSSLVLGTSRQMYQRTMDMVRELDRPEPQVMLAVLIAEVTLSDDLELGVEFAGQDLHFSEEAIVGPNGIIQGSNFDYVAGTNLGAEGSGLGFTFAVNGEDFSFLLHALQSNSRLEILSRPILMVRNGEEGNITIADSIPVVSSSQITDTGGISTGVGREDVGIILTATPHISPEGYVTITLKQEISNISGENVQLTEGVSQPVFSTRQVETNVTVRDGETVVIGGLITSRKSEGESKVPIIGDLPLIGALFRTTSVSDQKTELLIAMTVDIARTDEDVRRISLEERDRYTGSRKLFRDPLLEGLRILPDKSLLGPGEAQPAGPPADKAPEKKDTYGPKPKKYGPPVPPPQPTSATSRAAVNDEWPESKVE